MVRTRRSRSSGRRSDSNSQRSPKRSRIVHDSDRRRRDAALGINDQKGRRRQVSIEDFLVLTTALKPLGTEDGAEEDSELRIRGIDMHVTDNRVNHHTEDYEHECLLARRGQPFEVTLNFDRPFDNERDSVFVQLSTGSRPQKSKGTLIRVQARKEPPNSTEQWYVQHLSSGDKTVKLAVTPPSDAIIGYHTPYVETISTDSMGLTHQNRREFPSHKFIILFNPWCKDDDVYLEEEDERKEYVLNETGRIWNGTVSDCDGMPWNFGQFEDVVLDCVLWIMDEAELAAEARANPVIITRTISAWANKFDDNGVLEGRWDDNWPQGTTEPWAWTGSVEIIEQFMKRKKTVQFGQCWVFSGLVTSFMRAVGIPTRSVTNFESAHDTDASMTIDFHWNEDDDPVEALNDSVWNFHVWNESWFRRHDLPEGYDGWQAHDATPQEVSQGVMRCGPVSLKAVKEGNVYLPYDGPFVFAEVNGDKIHWLVKEDGETEVISFEKQVIGRKISTKSVGNNRRKDVTNLYKHKEGSEEERQAVHRAFRYSSKKEHAVYDVPEADVHFKLITPENARIGDSFTLKILMTNVSSEIRQVHARLRAVMMFYTGVTSEHIITETIEEKLQPNAEIEKSVTVTAEQYETLLRPEAAIQVYLLGKVKNTGRMYAHMEAFSLLKPQITIKVPEEMALREEFEMTLEFENPLKDTLTGGEFHIEAPGIVKSLIVPHKGSAAPGDMVSATTAISPRKAGKKEIIVKFSSPQLTGLTGSIEVYVKYNF